MQNNKACGPDGLPTENWRIVDKIDPMLICENERCPRKMHTGVWRTIIVTLLQSWKGQIATTID